MHALFVSLSTEIGLENPHVYLFADAVAATIFAVEALLKCGEMERTENGGIVIPDVAMAPTGATEALLEYQDRLGGSEYLHVYGVTDQP